MKQIKSSFKDLTSLVYTNFDETKIYRTLRFDPSTYNSLSVFPKVLGIVNNNLYEIEKIKFVNYYYEWTFEQFKDSAIYFLELLKELNKNNFILSDANPLNITYLGKGQFKFFDHGSLLRKENENWTAFYQFIKEYAYPLLFLSENQLAPPLSLLPYIASKDWTFNYKPSLKYIFSYKYLLLNSALKLSAKKSLNHLNQSKENSISNQYLYNIEFFIDFIKQLSRKKSKKTKWGNYYTQTVLGENYVNNKKTILLEYLNLIKNEIKIGLDLGASDGLMSQFLIDHNSNLKMICIESDSTASFDLYNRSKNTNIIPIYNSIYELSPEVGFLGQLESLNKRLPKTVDFLLSLGIIHHLMNEENLPFEHILQKFSDLIKPNGHLIIEFIDQKDPRHLLIQNINYPYPKSKEYFELAINKYFKIIKSNIVSDYRVLFLLKKNN